MAINTYATLKDAVQRWSKRTDSLSVVDDFIDLAESDIRQNLKVRDMEARATASASDRYLALPDGYVSIRKLRLVSGSESYELFCSTPESMNVVSGSGMPTSYAITSQIEFNRVPSSAYTIEMQYYKEITALSSSNPTNTVLTRFPMVYLYGCLFHYAQWAQDDAMLAKYAPLFDGAIKRANESDRKGRYGAAKSMRIEGPTP